MFTEQDTGTSIKFLKTLRQVLLDFSAKLKYFLLILEVRAKIDHAEGQSP